MRRLRRVLAIGPGLLRRRDLSPHGRPQIVVNFPRRYTDVCGHRGACTGAQLLGWRAQASRGTHADRTSGGSNIPQFRVRACARSTGMPPDYNAVDTAILRYCTVRSRSVLLPCPAVRCAHRLPARCNRLR